MIHPCINLKNNRGTILKISIHKIINLNRPIIYKSNRTKKDIQTRTIKKIINQNINKLIIGMNQIILTVITENLQITKIRGKVIKVTQINLGLLKITKNNIMIKINIKAHVIPINIHQTTTSRIITRSNLPN